MYRILCYNYSVVCSTASSTYYQINGARLVLVASSAIYMSHVVVILPAAGAAGEIITTSKDFGKYVFLHFSTGPVARAVAVSSSSLSLSFRLACCDCPCCSHCYAPF